MDQDGASRIRIVRLQQFADRLRSYQITLNGRDAGSLARNGVIEVTVPPGKATIEARIDWGRSRLLTIDARPGETVEIEVRNNWGPLLALWAATFGSGSYLTLRPTSPASTGQ
jgi:hypothetical protein